MFFFQSIIIAQNTSVIGKIVSGNTQKALENALVSVDNSVYAVRSNFEGIFELKKDLPLGEQVISISLKGFITKRFPIVIKGGAIINLGEIIISPDIKEQQEFFATIDLNNNQDSEYEISQNQVLLQANRDVFLSSVAFNWSSTFFKVRGLGSEYSKVLLNGVEMNSFYNNRPNWSNWSGLNDMLRSQEFTAYTQPNDQSFGSLIGTSQLKFDATNYRRGSKLSFASTNRSYRGRVMLTHHSGNLSRGWAYSLSASIAKAEEGFIEGTLLNNHSFISSVSKKINQTHRINATVIYASTERGKSSPNTQEVINIKGRKYNSYWGLQGSRLRNSRIKKVREPIFTINHFWNLNQKFKIQNNMLLQTGKVINTRLEFNGREVGVNTTSANPNFSGTSRNPDPSYYQRLPSFFLQNKAEEDFESAFKANREFNINGQLDWNDLYVRNQETSSGVYALYGDVLENTSFTANSIFNYELSPKINFYGKLAYRGLISKNYAEVTDLLGAKGFLDIDGFSEGNAAQNNLKTPNRIVGLGDKFKYDYDIKASNLNSFLQANLSIPNWEMYFGLSLEKTNYQRIGLFENGNYPGDASFGKSEKLSFIGFGFKGGATRKITNKLFLSSNFNLVSTPPSIRQSFSNPRQNNETIIGLKNENQIQIDGSLNYQYGYILARLSGYFIKRDDMTDVSFFFTESIASLGRTDSSAFIQEITTGIETINTGLEFGAEIQATSTFKINMSMAYGKHIYSNNPDLYITSDSFIDPLFLGKAFLKNYRIANGPQQAYGIGFSYRDPSFWWFTSQLNYFSKSFIDISPFTRTQNFATDIDGQPLLDYEKERARELLAQEDFGNYFLWNAIGGKSWRLKNNTYIGCTIGVQNILNQVFKTGGFEQSRNSNYRDLNEDQSRENPLFGSRYWQGSGTTYYVNTYWRF